MLFESGTVGPASAVVPTQLSAAMASGYILWLLQKSTNIPWVSQTTVKLNAIIRLIVSAASTIGISIAWEPTNHQIIIGNLTLAIVLHGLWHVFTQYAATHGFEKILNVIPSTSIPRAAEVVPTTVPAEPKKDEVLAATPKADS